MPMHGQPDLARWGRSRLFWHLQSDRIIQRLPAAMQEARLEQLATVRLSEAAWGSTDMAPNIHTISTRCTDCRITPASPQVAPLLLPLDAAGTAFEGFVAPSVRCASDCYLFCCCLPPDAKPLLHP